MSRGNRIVSWHGWCTGRNGGVHEVSCPAGPFWTEVKQQTLAGGAHVGPTHWSYHDRRHRA